MSGGKMDIKRDPSSLKCDFWTYVKERLEGSSLKRKNKGKDILGRRYFVLSVQRDVYIIISI